MGTFPFHRDRVEGVKLNSEQFNNYVRYVNEVDANGRVLGDPGYKPEEALLPALKSAVSSTEYFTMQFDEERFEELSGILTDRRASARAVLKKTDPSLNARLSFGEQ